MSSVYKKFKSDYGDVIRHKGAYVFVALLTVLEIAFIAVVFAFRLSGYFREGAWSRTEIVCAAAMVPLAYCAFALIVNFPFTEFLRRNVLELAAIGCSALADFLLVLVLEAGLPVFAQTQSGSAVGYVVALCAAVYFLCSGTFLSFARIRCGSKPVVDALIVIQYVLISLAFFAAVGYTAWAGLLF